jgi:hypothetical protein
MLQAEAGTVRDIVFERGTASDDQRETDMTVPPLAAAIVAEVSCWCPTCRGVPKFEYSSCFDDLVISGLECVERYPHILELLNEFARCRHVNDVLGIDDPDDLAKEVLSTYKADEIDPDCKKWAALVAYVRREAIGSYWGDQFRHLFEPLPPRVALQASKAKRGRLDHFHDDVSPLAKLCPIPPSRKF